MDELTAGQLLGVAPYTIRHIKPDLIRGVWLVTVRDMCSHTDTVRELTWAKAAGGVVTGTAYLVGETGPELADGGDVTVVPADQFDELTGSLDTPDEAPTPAKAAAKPKSPRKPKAKP